MYTHFSTAGQAGQWHPSSATCRKKWRIDTVTGKIQTSKGLRDKYPDLVDGTLLEELQHFHQLKTQGLFGKTLTKAQNEALEANVVDRLLKSGQGIFN